MRRGAVAGLTIVSLFAVPGAGRLALADEPVAKPAPLRIAVFDVRAAGVADDTARTLSEVLAVEVSKLPGVIVITNAEIESLLGLERKKQVMGCADDVSCVAEVAGSLGVEKLCSGSLGKVEETTVLTLRVIDVKTAKVDNRLYETNRMGASAFLEKMPDLVAKLFPASKKDAPAVAPPPEPVAVNRPYVSPAATPSQPVDSAFIAYVRKPVTWAIVGGVLMLLGGGAYGNNKGLGSSLVGGGMIAGAASVGLCVCPFWGSGGDEPAVRVVRPEPPSSAL